jgi:hypothetical protein
MKISLVQMSAWKIQIYERENRMAAKIIGTLNHPKLLSWPFQVPTLLQGSCHYEICK